MSAVPVRWAVAASAVAAALAASYLILVPTATWNAGLLFGAIAIANLGAALVQDADLRLRLLGGALSASLAMGALTASVGIVLLAAAACTFMALRAESAGAAGGRASTVGLGAVLGLVALVAVWIAPKILVR